MAGKLIYAETIRVLINPAPAKTSDTIFNLGATPKPPSYWNIVGFTSTIQNITPSVPFDRLTVAVLISGQGFQIQEFTPYTPSNLAKQIRSEMISANFTLPWCDTIQLEFVSEDDTIAPFAEFNYTLNLFGTVER